MKSRLQSLPPRALVGIAAALVLLYGAALWFVLISPARADAAAAKEDLAAAELRLVEAKAMSNRPQSRSAPVADVFRLAKAMPGSVEQPGLVLELSRLAKRGGVTLQGIAPQTPVAAVGGPSLIPLRVTVGGSYAQITKFLRLTRGLVAVRNGKIHARGRLLSVESVSLVESVVHGFPKLDANLIVNAYVYDGPIAPEEVPAPTGEEPLDATSTAIGGTGS